MASSSFSLGHFLYGDSFFYYGMEVGQKYKFIVLIHF